MRMQHGRVALAARALSALIPEPRDERPRYRCQERRSFFNQSRAALTLRTAPSRSSLLRFFISWVMRGAPSPPASARDSVFSAAVIGERFPGFERVFERCASRFTVRASEMNFLHAPVVMTCGKLLENCGPSSVKHCASSGLANSAFR